MCFLIGFVPIIDSIYFWVLIFQIPICRSEFAPHPQLQVKNILNHHINHLNLLQQIMQYQVALLHFVLFIVECGAFSGDHLYHIIKLFQYCFQVCV